MSAEYRVRLDAFEGPLDLLLHLVRRAEVDLEDIPLAIIADQYIEHLAEIDRVDIELAGEFLVMAATLTEIKSRLIAVANEGEGQDARERATGEPAEDPRKELVRQLLEYKKFRDASDALEERREAWSMRYPVGGARANAEAMAAAREAASELDMEDLDVLDLVRAFERIIESVNFDRLGEHSVVDDDTPLELHAADLEDRLRREHGRLSLETVFQGRTRAEMLGLFLALLEMLKQQRARARQLRIGGPIVIELREPDGASV